ncbi:hypothetical protein HUJ05_007187 [Dendroctonus ponderosae]|nr:hypothetical protein HUJ05_007187 [Dendroctonus ponderosae]
MICVASPFQSLTDPIIWSSTEGAPPGPFYIHFKATSVLTAVNNVYPSDTTGFSMNYEITTPQGAIQFFGDTTGWVKSFGYDPIGGSQYSTRLHYSIAFRRTASSCSIK